MFEKPHKQKKDINQSCDGLNTILFTNSLALSQNFSEIKSRSPQVKILGSKEKLKEISLTRNTHSSNFNSNEIYYRRIHEPKRTEESQQSIKKDDRNIQPHKKRQKQNLIQLLQVLQTRQLKNSRTPNQEFRLASVSKYKPSSSYNKKNIEKKDTTSDSNKQTPNLKISKQLNSISKNETPRKKMEADQYNKTIAVTNYRTTTQKTQMEIPFDQSSTAQIKELHERKNMTKIKAFYETLWNNQLQYQMLIVPTKHTKTRAYVSKGNNGNLVQQVLQKRWWWRFNENWNLDTPSTSLNFLWTDLKRTPFHEAETEKQIQSDENSLLNEITQSKFNFNNESTSMIIPYIQFAKEKNFLIVQDPLQIMMHNHFRNNQLIGDKMNLYYTMKRFYKKQQIPLKDRLPKTYVVSDINDRNFIKFQLYTRRHQNDKDIWLIKPGENSNRGKGIEIYEEFHDIKNFILSRQSSDKQQHFIIQKYLSDPLLYKNRKFDIRCYMLMTCFNSNFKGYWFQGGYVRTSSHRFCLGDFKNQYVHLTNDAIQINCGTYGKFEQGNKLSLNELDQYIRLQSGSKFSFYDNIFPHLEQYAIDIIQASYNMLEDANYGQNFELFGLDFMIDSNYKPWLIECNTNPCLETTSSLLSNIIPDMLEQLMQLTVDLIYPPPFNWSIKKTFELNDSKINKENKFKLIYEENLKQVK